jgi:hypothetical protein
MPITITVQKTGLTVTNTYNWDDALVDKLIAYAQATFRNPDGTQPGPNAALNRLERSMVQGLRDRARFSEWEQDRPAPEVEP